jgi:hypothetical protein
MWLVGTTYNFCWVHESLRLRAIGGRHKWQQRTPAMAAGLTDHVWTVDELLRYRVPPVDSASPPQRARPPNVINLAWRRRAKARAREAVA